MFVVRADLSGSTEDNMFQTGICGLSLWPCVPPEARSYQCESLFLMTTKHPAVLSQLSEGNECLSNRTHSTLFSFYHYHWNHSCLGQFVSTSQTNMTTCSCLNHCDSQRQEWRPHCNAVLQRPLLSDTCLTEDHQSSEVKQWAPSLNVASSLNQCLQPFLLL